MAQNIFKYFWFHIITDIVLFFRQQSKRKIYIWQSTLTPRWWFDALIFVLHRKPEERWNIRILDLLKENFRKFSSYKIEGHNFGPHLVLFHLFLTTLPLCHCLPSIAEESSLLFDNFQQWPSFLFMCFDYVFVFCCTDFIILYTYTWKFALIFWWFIVSGSLKCVEMEYNNVFIK